MPRSVLIPGSPRKRERSECFSWGGSCRRAFQGLLAAQQLLVRADHPAGERLLALTVGQEVRDDHGHVVVEPLAGHLVRAELAAEVGLQPGGATEVHLEAADL